MSVKNKSFLIPIAAAIGALAASSTPVLASVDKSESSQDKTDGLSKAPAGMTGHKMTYVKGDELHGLLLNKSADGLVMAYHTSHSSHSSHRSHSSHYSSR